MRVRRCPGVETRLLTFTPKKALAAAVAFQLGPVARPNGCVVSDHTRGATSASNSISFHERVRRYSARGVVLTDEFAPDDDVRAVQQTLGSPT